MAYLQEFNIIRADDFLHTYRQKTDGIFYKLSYKAYFITMCKLWNGTELKETPEWT